MDFDGFLGSVGGWVFEVDGSWGGNMWMYFFLVHSYLVSMGMHRGVSGVRFKS